MDVFSCTSKYFKTVPVAKYDKSIVNDEIRHKAEKRRNVLVKTLCANSRISMYENKNKNITKVDHSDVTSPYVTVKIEGKKRTNTH